MKKGCILCLLISVISLPLIAQNIIYSNLKELLAQHGDTIAVLRVEKRSRNQIVFTGGADYRITAGDDESMCRRLKKRCFAVRDEKGDLYLNCRKELKQPVVHESLLRNIVRIGCRNIELVTVSLLRKHIFICRNDSNKMRVP